VPPRVLAVAAGRFVHLTWRNDQGGLTYEIGSGQERCFCKWVPSESPVTLEAERLRMQWASAWGRVPAVLSHGADAAGSWLVTSALPGENALSGRWMSDPASAVKAIGAGLRNFHERLPVDGCPFSAAPEVLLAELRQRAAAGKVQRAHWHPSHRTLDLAQAFARLAQPPPIDVLVVCHGDASAPNTLIDDEGEYSGHVDLGALGVADRWSDLAIATWSAQWNYGPGWEGALLHAYGVTPDPERTRYYRLLWDLT
jgi:aminoglycoside phosphotransferase